VEIAAIFLAIKEYQMPCSLYTAGNEGVGMKVWETDSDKGIPQCPGVEYDRSDVELVIQIWQEHIFPNPAPAYPYGSSHDVLVKCFDLFLPYVMHENNQELLRRFKFSKREREPKLIDFEY
jgi:hypothetical protein